MKPSIVKAGLCLAVTAAALAPSAGILPAVAVAAPPDQDMSTKLAGKTVFLDPGHQGGEHAQDISRQVNDGRGGTKECQTTGMTTLNGVPEHTVTWNVSQLVKQSLEAMGATVVLSRQDDTGWGGCVDERAAAANRSGADVAISIHADGGPASGSGFHLIVPQLPVPDVKANLVQSSAGMAATKVVRDAYLQAGFPAATYNGAVDGLQTRSDIAGPALTQVPDVFLEMGNGVNTDDAALLESREGQLKHAVAIATGLTGYLLGYGDTPPPSGSAGGQAASHPVPGQSEQGSPGQAVPAQSAPGQPAPDQVPPGQSARQNAVPSRAVPAQVVPDQASPEQVVPGQTSPGQSVPGQASPGSVPGQASPNQSVPGQTSPGQSVPGQTSPGQSVPGQAGTGQSTPGGSGQSSTSPGASAPSGYTPGAPNVYTAPDAYTPGAPNSGNSGTPGAYSQGTSPGGQSQQGTESTPDTSASGLVTTAMQLLLPLAKSLGMEDATVNSQLINLAYTLASTLLGPGGSSSPNSQSEPATPGTQNSPGAQNTPGTQNNLGTRSTPSTR
ncbi:N-acetylmuramoyl-L-alanine amidase [Nocardia transvalensis]|uniref:N-acetylmuramoyl-L-alanine amidase n=1 Tax=Nocardia transvalensis TaxID=37333 RepID=A0A7W9P986_9NOCA|nr:N-acetylmuramoyl-L-alanine amidase [Nocardia transvalensis]